MHGRTIAEKRRKTGKLALGRCDVNSTWPQHCNSTAGGLCHPTQHKQHIDSTGSRQRLTRHRDWVRCQAARLQAGRGVLGSARCGAATRARAVDAATAVSPFRSFSIHQSILWRGASPHRPKRCDGEVLCRCFEHETEAGCWTSRWHFCCFRGFSGSTLPHASVLCFITAHSTRQDGCKRRCSRR